MGGGYGNRGGHRIRNRDERRIRPTNDERGGIQPPLSYVLDPVASSLGIRSPYGGHGSVVPAYGGEIVSVGSPAAV